MENTWSQLKREILSCSKCNKIARTRKKPVLGAGSCNAKVVIVGLAPGKDGADLTGIPFTRDPSGELINELLVIAGLSREQDVYITNLVKCNPKNEKGCNRPPSKTEIANCSDYLKREIDQLKPKIIITFGRDATEFLIETKISQMGNVHGRLQSKNEHLIFPFMHPAYVIRGAYDKKKYIDEFRVFGEVYRKLMAEESQISRLDVLLTLIEKSTINDTVGIVRGKTRLQKLVFLVERELKRRGYRPRYSFRPYLYGPYSRELYTDVEWLKMQEMVTTQRIFYEDSGVVTDFIITNMGRERINSLKNLKAYEQINAAVDYVLKNYGNMKITQLVEFVHREFKGYHNPKPKEKKTASAKLDKFIIQES